MCLSKLSSYQYGQSYKFHKYYPCGECGSHCDSNENFILYCEVCEKKFHRSCLKISKKKYKEIISKNETFVCSEKCMNSLLPLHSDDINFFSALYGDGLYPCGKCKIDCTDYSACIQCSICDTWNHFECSNLSKEEFFSNPYYFCSVACEVCLLPFTEIDTKSLIKSGILSKTAHNKPRSRKKRKVKKSSLNHEDLSKNYVKFDHFLKINCSYLDPNAIDENYFKNDSHLTIFQNNIRSQNKNFHKVREIFDEAKNWPDILAFTETKLNENSSIPNLNGYAFENINSETACGGVGVYVSDHIDYILREDLKMNVPGVEDIWIELKIGVGNHEKSSSKDTDKFVIGTIYRHPITSNYDQFCDNLCASLEILNREKTKYNLLGDFNIDILKYNLVTSVSNFINSLNSLGCAFHVDKPTRVTAKSFSCIDHVYSNLEPDKLENQILLSDVSDHFGIITKIYGSSKMHQQLPIYYRKTKLGEQEWANFNHELSIALHSKLSKQMNSVNCDVNNFASSLTSTYHDLIEKYMPLKKLSRKQKRFSSKPWISKGMKTSIKTKNKLYALSKKTNDPIDIRKYKKFRNILTNIKLRSKYDYYSELAIRYGNNKSKIWRLVNDISNRKRCANNTIKSMKNSNGKKLCEPKLIAQCLNKHFSSVGENMASKFKNLDISKDPTDYISCDITNPANLSCTNLPEITKLILSLVLKKACGYDLISNRILRSSCYVIAPYLTFLFNNCLKKGIFPDCFKVAQVVSLFKGGDKQDPSCYRPISLLPAIGKLLEKIVAVRTIDFLNKNTILSKHQFGFRKSYSTEYPILDIYEKLLNNLDKGLSSCAIFLDLAKAFDSVDHGILLRKLSKYGIKKNFLNFFTSYLDKRSQFVKLGNTKSDTLPIKFGVPQGSILGPLLFLIFINDLPNATNFFIKLFADDTFLCAQNSDFMSLQSEVNCELQKVSDWLFCNKLTLNIDKCKFMIISNKKKIPQDFSVNIEKSPLKQCNQYKYLGVKLDKNLSWKAHIEYVSSKISKACGILAKLRHSVSTKLLVEIYHALIHSYLRYGIVVWGNASEENLKPLNALVNRAVKIMTFTPFVREELGPLYSDLKVLNLKNVFKLETAKYMYKVKNGLLPTIIGNYFELEYDYCLNPERSIKLRKRERPNKINTRLASSKKSIQIRGESVWNKISESVRNKNSIYSFKKHYKVTLLSNSVG